MKASGNDGLASRAVEREVEGRPTLDLGRARDGGMWGYWFCGRCNTRRTKRWDDEYLRWWHPIARAIHVADEPPRQTLLGEFAEADPGAFVRCLWAWMFALNPNLLDSHPKLAESVREGTAVEPPDDLKLLLAVTPDLGIWCCGQPGAVEVNLPTSGDSWSQTNGWLWQPSSNATDLPIAVVAAPPFNVVLASATHRHQLPHFNTGGWLRDRAGDRRVTSIQAPMVHVVGQRPAGGVSYRHIQPVPLAEPNGRVAS